MPEPNTPIPFPAKGLSEEVATIAQRPLTSREMVNVRVRDPKTGRNRGAQRVGTSRFSATGLLGPVRQMKQLSYEKRRHTYTVNDDVGEVTVEWEVDAPSGKDSKRIAADKHGNVYIVHDESRITKYNPKGKLITSFHVPTEDTDHIVRALTVGPDGAVYVATSTGPANVTPKIWRYVQDEEGDYKIHWSGDVLGFVPAMVVQRGLLYTLENISVDTFPSGIPTTGLIGSAELVVYDSLTASAPRSRWRRSVPFPANDLAVNDADEVFVVSSQNSKRGLSQGRECSTPSVYWSPSDLPNWSDMKWTWLDARELSSLSDGDQVRFWTDKTGNDRDAFYWDYDTDQGGMFHNINPPRFSASGLCDQPTVRFNGRNGLASHDTRNVGDSDNVAALNKNILPAFSNTRWVAVMLLLPSVSRNTRGCALEQMGEAKFRLISNESYNFNSDSFLQNDGVMRLAVTPGVQFSGGSSGKLSHQPPAASYISGHATLRDDIAIVVIRHAGDDAANSKYRMNGLEIDDFTINREQSLNPTLLGFTFDENGLPQGFSERPDNFSGDIAEILVVRDLSTSQGDASNRAITAIEIELLEGYIAHRWGAQHVLDASHPFALQPPGSSGGSSGLASGDASGVGAPLRSQEPVLAKYGPNGGDVIWAFNGSGVGYSVVVDSDGDVYTVGPQVFRPSWGGSADLHAGGYNATVRKFTDNGDTYTLAWQLDSWDVSPVEAPINIAIDAEKNLYIPHYRDTMMPSGASTTAGPASLYKITAAGAIEWGFSIDAASPPPGEDATLLGYDVVLDPRAFDTGNSAVKEPEFCYLVTRNTGGEEVLHKIRLLTAAQTQGALRTHIVVAAVGANIRTITPSSGTVNTPTGSTSSVDANANWIAMDSLFQQMFITDGETYRVYDPIDDEVKLYEPTSAGEALPRCKLLVAWGDRLVIARPDGDAHNWMMMGKGDPYDVDLAPPVTNDLQAVVGNDSRAGLFPDIANALVPYTDDLLLIGGDHSIHRLTGDPLAGGVFDLVTDEVGMAFGAPWAKDPTGVLYFFGQKGAIFALVPVPGQQPVQISTQIEDRLRNVNLTTHTVRMAWDWKNECLDVFIVPYGSSSATTHFCWEKEQRAWSETTFSNTNMEPHSLMVLDGDAPGDRVTLIGCSDGFVRKWDDAVENDDDGDNDYAVDSKVLIGPFGLGLETEARLQWLSVNLSNQQNGARVEVLASDAPETIPTDPTFAFRVEAGRSGMIRERARGMALWLRIRNGSVGERWSYEHGSMKLVPGGRVR